MLLHWGTFILLCLIRVKLLFNRQPFGSHYMNHRFTEYCELEGTHKDKVQLLSEWPIQGFNQQLWHF